MHQAFTARFTFVVCYLIAATYVSEAFVFQGQVCGPIPNKRGENYANCTFFKTGNFTSTTPPNSSKQQAWDPEQPRCTDADLSGTYVGDFWTPSNANCSLHRFTDEEVYRCLKGKRVVLAGDSMLRQVTHRLIAFLRGIEKPADHLHHSNSMYYMNGMFDLYRLEAAHDLIPVPSYFNSSVEIKEHELVLQFIWAPNDFPADLVKQLHPDILVTGPMYHITSVAADFQQSVASTLASLSPTKQVKLFWATTPLKDLSKKEQAYFRERNTYARGFHSALRQFLPESLILAMDKLADASPWNRNDHFHFGCYANVFSGTPPKPKKGRDCRDMFNYNVLQVFLNAVCTPENLV